MIAISLLLALVPGQDTLHYNFTFSNAQQIDATAAGQGMIDIQMQASGRFGVIARDSADGTILTLVVDTATIVSDNPMMPAEMLALPSGTVVTVFTRDGEIAGPPDVQPSSMGGTTLLGPLSALIAEPRADAAIGDRWTDTTAVDSTTADGGNTQINSLAEWTVAGAEGNALIYEVRVNTTTSGASPMGPMQATMTSTQRIVRGTGELARSVTGTTSGDTTMGGGGGPTITAQVTSTLQVDLIP